MDIENTLKENFKEVNKAYFEKEAGINYLRIEVNVRSLDKIAIISKSISDFLDVNDPSDANYYLDIFSPGTDEYFDAKDALNHIGENVQVTLKKNIKDKNEFIGEVLSADDNEVVVRWNAKGQFRKQPISIDNIEKIKKYIKIKK